MGDVAVGASTTLIVQPVRNRESIVLRRRPRLVQRTHEEDAEAGEDFEGDAGLITHFGRRTAMSVFVGGRGAPSVPLAFCIR